MHENQGNFRTFLQSTFLQFQADLAESLNNVRGWSEKDREEFLVDLRKNGNLFFRIPRGFNEHNDGVCTKLAAGLIILYFILS